MYTEKDARMDHTVSEEDLIANKQTMSAIEDMLTRQKWKQKSLFSKILHWLILLFIIGIIAMSLT